MKKNFFIGIVSLLCVLFCTLGFSSCKALNKNDKITVVVTVFSGYDWVMNVLGEEKENVEVTFLLNSGADLHNYQPTVKDIAAVSSCDLFVCVGGESENWTEDALKNPVNKDRKILELLPLLGDRAKEEEEVEGMQAEEEEEEEEEETSPEYDEHVWLSLKNASFFVGKIAETLGELDPDHAETYLQNAKDYASELNELDGEFATAVNAGKYDTLVFGDRFPFRYLTDDYGLNYYAAFKGCSAETEASFETVVFLAGKVDELDVGSILIIESSDGKIAETIRNNTVKKNQKILTLDSLQSSTTLDYEKGKTYLSAMRGNLETLKEAVG